MALKGKNAIVTGSTSGIGLAIAQVLAEHGCNIMLNGMGDKAAIDALVANFPKQYGVKTFYSDADMSKPAEIRTMVADAVAKLGRVDILVNNAGIQFTAPVEEFPEDKWDAIISINLSAAFHAIKAAVPGMRASKFGRIVNIASAHGLVASTHKAAYVAAKHGIVGLTKVVALETAESGITCNAICPGWVDTPLVQKQIADKAKQGNISVEQATANLLGEKQPNKKFIKPESIGALIAFLADEHGDAMTGEILSIDGGWTAQ
ncbi:MAG TPA: 3-hydroxybutyrate dehydrogenase [Rickettsiales bacterium]|nr:3-hydroxybutyrate dehydrogenase [Rickettsiales bacterium]